MSDHTDHDFDRELTSKLCNLCDSIDERNRRQFRRMLVWLALLLTVVGIICWAMVAYSAPAPLPRRHQPKFDLAGCWQLQWSTTNYVMHLSPDGRYEAGALFREAWKGEWRLQGRTLIVRETQDGRTWIEWRVELDERMCGRWGMTEVRLTRVE